RAEHPRCEAVGGDLARGGHGRGARPVVDQRDLAEVVAGPSGAFLLAADAVLDRAGADDEEAHTTGALGGDRLAGRERVLLETFREAFEIAVGDVREERNLPEEVE